MIIVSRPDIFPKPMRAGGYYPLFTYKLLKIDAVLSHNKLRDILVESFHRAHIRVQVEAGSGLSQDHSNSRPADILVFDWDRGKPAALDLTVVSPLNANILKEAGMADGTAAQAAEVRKHTADGQRCTNLGWSCIPSSCCGIVSRMGQRSPDVFHTSCHTTGCSQFKQQVKDDFRAVQPTEPGSD